LAELISEDDTVRSRAEGIVLDVMKSACGDIPKMFLERMREVAREIKEGKSHEA